MRLILLSVKIKIRLKKWSGPPILKEANQITKVITDADEGREVASQIFELKMQEQRQNKEFANTISNQCSIASNRGCS